MKNLFKCFVLMVFLFANAVSAQTLTLTSVITQSFNFFNSSIHYDQAAEAMVPGRIEVTLTVIRDGGVGIASTTKDFYRDSIYENKTYVRFLSSPNTSLSSSASYVSTKGGSGLKLQTIIRGNKVQITISQGVDKTLTLTDLYLHSPSIEKINSTTTSSGLVCNTYLIKGMDTTGKNYIALKLVQQP